ncbi:MAG: tRNA pseudouridine(55) synthase TruB [Candidatus Zixiibacteriota bacterium]
MASGLLLIMVENATKIARYLSGLDKTYVATVRIGWRSTTGDADGELEVEGDPGAVSEQQLSSAVAAHRGRLTQSIPAYAAKRIHGKRRYELARAGRDVPEMTRDVAIHDLDLLSWRSPDAEIRVRCSSGTYVRSLAESIGRAVGCGGYLTALRREAIGEWSVADALTVDDLSGPVVLRPVDAFLAFPRLELNDDDVHIVDHGTPVLRRHVRQLHGVFTEGAIVVLSDHEGRARAIGRALLDSADWESRMDEDHVFHYERVLK